MKNTNSNIINILNATIEAIKAHTNKLGEIAKVLVETHPVSTKTAW